VYDQDDLLIELIQIIKGAYVEIYRWNITAYAPLNIYYRDGSIKIDFRCCCVCGVIDEAAIRVSGMTCEASHETFHIYLKLLIDDLWLKLRSLPRFLES